ncbi:LysM peptidoglycan-binding domain-containing protein [bacterium]|nr:LysM peptidoglycan-binding domain-containing protein [bacterium]
MKKSDLFFLIALAAVITLAGCKSAPEQDDSAFSTDVELTSTEDSTYSNDSFGGTSSSSESFALSDNGSSSSFGLGEQVDQEVLGGRTGDDVFIDPSAPAVDSSYSYRPGSDGFVPLRGGYSSSSLSYTGNSYPASSGTGYIDSSSSWKSSSSSAKASGGTYTVKKGDSLWKIARANGCTVQSLADANGLNANGILKIGTKLKIPGSSKSSYSSGSAASGSTYTVKNGDSYYTIGKKLGVNYLKLMKANGGDDKLKPGQVITIP